MIKRLDFNFFLFYMFVYRYPWLTLYIECNMEVDIEDNSFFS